MDWTEDSISLLRSLWDQGLSTAEIGRRMSITKNAVVGKAHRLELPARPSPIRKMLDAAMGPAGGQAGAAVTVPAASRGVPATSGAKRDETALDTGTAAPPPRRADVAADVVALPAAEPRVAEPGRTVAAGAPAAAAPVPASSGAGAGGGTVHVLRPAMPPTPPRSAEPEEIPDAAVAPRTVPAARAEAPRRRGLTCCWPLGEPGTKEFHFCGGDPVPNKPYCAEHAALAYVKVRDRRDSVA